MDTQHDLLQLSRYLIELQEDKLLAVRADIALTAVARLLKQFKFVYPERQLAMYCDLIHSERKGPRGAGLVPEALLSGLQACVSAIRDAVSQQAQEREIVTLDRCEASRALRDLTDCVTDPYQRVLLADAIRCLECHANYAAVVMAWNLTYDRLRRWIFRSRKRRAAFNAVLVTRKVDGVPYQTAVAYDDLIELGERFLIDVAYQAKLFPKQKHQVLVNALTDRNHFAHPSHRKLTPTTAAGYVETLVINIHRDRVFA